MPFNVEKPPVGGFINRPDGRAGVLRRKAKAEIVDANRIAVELLKLRKPAAAENNANSKGGIRARRTT